MAYYDGAKLLSMKDINGQQPEIYICTTNRTGGKTTYFNRLMSWTTLRISSSRTSTRCSSLMIP